MKNSCLLLFFVVTLLSAAQTANYKNIDNYTHLVSEKYKGNALKEKPLEGKSDIGGKVTGYYMKTKLVLITTHSSDEFSYNDYLFYVEDDSLIYVKVKHVVLKEPINEKEYAEYEKYVLLNTDHKGNTDVKKWPLVMDLNNTYYINNNQIVKYTLNNLGKDLKPAEGELEGITKDLINRYSIHLEELK